RCRWNSQRWRRWRDRAPAGRRGKTRDTSMSKWDGPPAGFVLPSEQLRGFGTWFFTAAGMP
ncbi:MAG: hypothetical protein OXL34_02050, partial [Gemmatimonadota bacterium]|nr:hypothetical protein [Gemmatimonadota bacterium]